MKADVRLLLFVLIMGFVNNACNGDPDNTEKPDPTTGGKVIFEDNFNQTGRIPDTTKWSLCTHYIGDPFISGSYDQAYVENGKLILVGEKVGGIYKTGGIWTRDKFDFIYGKVEVSARFVTAQGGWPAIWLMPYQKADGTTDGEIDIIEQISNESVVYQTIHSYYIDHLNHVVPANQNIASYNVGEFNTYAIEWTKDKITYSVNGKTTLVYPDLYLPDEAIMRQWPFNKKFYLILNFALGGPDTWPGAITDSQLPARMEVDWVEVTQ